MKCWTLSCSDSWAVFALMSPPAKAHKKAGQCKLSVTAERHVSFIYVLNDTGDLGFRLVIIDFSVFDDTVLSNFVSVK